MTDATMTQAAPGVVHQKSWKPLGLLPPDIQWWIGFAAKGALAVFMHNAYDVVNLGHDFAMLNSLSTTNGAGGLTSYMNSNPNVFTTEATNALAEYMKENPPTYKNWWKMDFSEFMHQKPEIFTEAMREKIEEYSHHYAGLGSLYISKLGGFAGNKIAEKIIAGEAPEDSKKDSWSAYLFRKIIPGAIYCALFSATYGTPMLALQSFIVTTALTDIAYKLLGEKMLGLSHIKS